MTDYVLMPAADYQNICDAVRGKTGSTELLCSGDLAEKIESISTERYYDAFWDAYQDNGNLTDVPYLFAGMGWNEKTFYPKYNVFDGTMKMYYTFYHNGFAGDFVARMVELGFGDTCFVSSSPTQPFRNMSQVTRIPAVRPTEKGFMYSMNYAYNGCAALETIDCVVATDPNSGRPVTFTSTFDGCMSLKNIRFEGVIAKNISFADSPLLTTESVQDIIDHMKDLTGETTQTLTFHASVGANLTEAQKAAITVKNWTLVY